MQDQIIANGSLPALFHSEILNRGEKWKSKLCICFLENACQGEIVKIYYGYASNKLECATRLVG